MNAGLQSSIVLYNSTHAASWHCYLNCGGEKTDNPGDIYIVCFQVLHHPSEHVTSSIKHNLLLKPHIPKIIKNTE
jgi:hypothetical protein